MVRIAANKIIIGAVLLVLGYWLGMPQFTGYSNAIVSSFLILAGIFVLGSWGPDALQAIWSGVIKGPQIALISVATVALGSVISGTFSFTWWWYGEPMSWLNTPTSGFGRYVMGIGFVLQYLSEDFQISRYRQPKLWFVIVAIALSVSLGILIGYTWGDSSVGQAMLNRPA